MMTVELKRYGEKAKQVQVSTLREASQKVSAYIKENELGGSVWEGGFVRLNGKKTWFVSYNGRVWAGNGHWTPSTPEVTGDELDKVQE